MKQKGKRTLTPKLRFPEFRDKGEWEPTTIGEHVNLLSGFPFEGMDIIEDSAGVPLMRGINITEGRIRHDPDYDRFYLGPTENLAKYRLQEGDLVIGMDGSKVGKNSAMITSADIGALLVQRVARLRSDRQVTMSFIFQIVTSPKFHSYVDRINTSSGIPHISSKQINDFPLAIPCDAEQQKIAECLGSLDGLIAAEVRKLAGLRDHKRGLMQQLLPQPGQTQPRLRFPEFRDKGEWEEKPLSVIAENLDNKRVPITESDRIKGDIPYYGASGIVDYVRDYIFDEDLLCVSEDGANLVARTYPIAFPISGKTWVNNHAHVLRFDKPATQKMVEDYLNSTDLRDFITGMAQPKLNRTMLDTIPIPLPEQEEQKRIADCLTALDDRITAQAAKIDALKTHKRGLMHQLFAAPEEHK